jgi:hypothetical protein
MGDEEEAQERLEVMCLTCLRRPSRPGSVYCSRTCRVLHALRLVRGGWCWTPQLPLA